MGKFILIVLATVCVCWGVYVYFPESTRIAFHIPRMGTAVSYMTCVGLVFGAGFWRIAHGK